MAASRPSPLRAGIRVGAHLLLLVAAAHAMVVIWVAPVVPEDDAYITLRYAANLADGQGLVYNPGENVLATTSPLYAVLLAGVGRAAGPEALPAASIRLNLLWLPISAALLVLLLRRLGLESPLPELSAAWFLLIPTTLTVALGGMEPWLLAVLMLAAFTATTWRRWTLAAVLAVGAALVRPEGAFALLIVGAACWLADRGSFTSVVKGAAIPLTVWAAAATIVYGSPIPQSVTAKIATPGGTASVIRALTSHIGQWLFGIEGWGAVAIAASLALAIAAMVAPRPPGAVLARLLPTLLLLVVAELVLAGPGWFPWYGGIVLLPWFLTVVIGLDGVARIGGRLRDHLRLGSVSLVGVFALFGLVGSLLATGLPLWPGSAYGVFTPYRLRVLSYQRAAVWLEEHAPPGSSVMAAEIGMLGFVYRKGPLLDSAGLITDEALEHRAPLGPGNPTGAAISPELVRRMRPDFVVTIPQHGALLAGDRDFSTHYDLAVALDVPNRPYPDYRSLVLARKPAAPR